MTHSNHMRPITVLHQKPLRGPVGHVISPWCLTVVSITLVSITLASMRRSAKLFKETPPQTIKNNPPKRTHFPRREPVLDCRALDGEQRLFRMFCRAQPVVPAE